MKIKSQDNGRRKTFNRLTACKELHQIISLVQIMEPGADHET